MNIQKLKLLLATACLAPLSLIAQITEKERSADKAGYQIMFLRNEQVVETNNFTIQ